jgi:predicted ATP-grasp superfamily ATP-dependent carboligase
MEKKRVLVYPCGTEIGLEIYRSVHNSIHFELIGGSSSYDHGRFVFENHIDNMPFIDDDSSINDIEIFNKIVFDNKIDIIYPAMDGVLYKFAQYSQNLSAIIISPSYNTAQITRSKLKTYKVLKNKVRTPRIYNTIEEVEKYPIFVKPDVGQGSVGARKINSEEELFNYKSASDKKIVISEYLCGPEYTVDCFTNINGELIYASARQRNRMKNGISVNSTEKEDERFFQIAKNINEEINNIGGWFFQIKENENHEYTLLEVASRIAGTSAFCRCKGINLPLLTLFSFCGNTIESVCINDYDYYELDRALYNSFKIELKYNTVYIDFDDTIFVNNKINIQIITFLYQCLNNNIKLILITKHKQNITEKLKKLKIFEIFDEIISLKENEEKQYYIKSKDAIFIDDSYGERIKIKENCNINVFDTHMIECLIDGGAI